MRRLKAIIVATAVTALAVTALGAPASAQLVERGTLTFVNGIPGQKVDVCVNGKEIRSGLPYGGKKAKRMFAAQKMVKFFKKDPRRCRGKLLATKRVNLLPDAEYTVVITKKKPRKVLVFNNTPLVQLRTASWRYAGDMGDVDLKYDLWFKFFEDEPLVPIVPAANGTAWKKGYFSHAEFPVGGVIRTKASWPGQVRAFASSPAVFYDPTKSVEWILVGTTAKNARFVLVRRYVVGPG
jgi:hypothetical protein